MRTDEQPHRRQQEPVPPAEAEADGGATEHGVPLFRDLGPEECKAILGRNVVGRLAYSFRDRVSIEPVSYIYHDGSIYGRTSASDKLDVLRHSRWVAFEVDEVEGMFEWRSAVAHGAFYRLEREGSQIDRAAYDRALALARRLIPETGTREDPVPHRNVLFRIFVDELTGREATTRAD
jgi:hypothetical protein